MKQLVVLGSTGSIGQQTLDIVRAFPERFKVLGLSAKNNVSLLTEQIKEFQPSYVNYPEDDTRFEEIQPSLTANKAELLPLDNIIGQSQADIVVIAISGSAGLIPTLTAVKAGKTVALANKESLVMAGEIIIREAEINNASILPIDSEHSALWQCLINEKQNVSQLILTASGGPFLHHTQLQLEEATTEQALMHPSWQMGRKITIDSATMINKGFEVIEAHWLFQVPFDNIKVLVHPQSIVHSMVEFIDGSIKAQLSCPDMRLPIQYALSYPERFSNPQLPKLDLDRLSNLTFEEPDFDKFPCLKLSIAAGRKGGTYPTVLCVADEVAVELFLSQLISFPDIPRIIEQVLEKHQSIVNPTLDDILAADKWTRDMVALLTTGVSR
ncbi:1-deoxy-D-xylulose-5-phosphate reductoisomerase [Chloroflexota bacterium]